MIFLAPDGTRSSLLEDDEIITNECHVPIGNKDWGSKGFPVGMRYRRSENVWIAGPESRTKIVAGKANEITLKPSEATVKRWFEKTSNPGGFALADALMALEDPAPEDDLRERAKICDSKRHKALENLIEKTAEAIKEAASREELTTEAALFSQEAINKSCEVLKRKLKKLGIRMTEEMIKETILDHITECAAELAAQSAAKATEDFATNQCRKSKEMDPSDKSIHVTFDEFEGPDILDDGRGDVRVTLDTKRGMERLHLFPKQARNLYAALGVWLRKPGSPAFAPRPNLGSNPEASA